MTDLAITGSSVVAGSDAQIRTYFAATGVGAGDVVYLSSTNTVGKADADSATAQEQVPLGIALHQAAAGQPVHVQTDGDITIGATLTKGAVYYLSPTNAAGALCPFGDLSSGDSISLIGIAISTTVLRLRITPTGATV